MALSKIEDIRALNDEEIAEQILAVKRDLLDLRVKKKLGSLEQPHQFKALRRKLAQLMTVRTEKQTSDSTAN